MCGNFGFMFGVLGVLIEVFGFFILKICGGGFLEFVFWRCLRLILGEFWVKLSFKVGVFWVFLGFIFFGSFWGFYRVIYGDVGLLYFEYFGGFRGFEYFFYGCLWVISFRGVFGFIF